MSPSIVPFTPAHVVEAARIVGRTPLFAPYEYDEDTARLDLETALKAGRAEVHLLAALDGERLVGFARFVERGCFDRCGYLRLIAVDPDHTSSGVGQRLLGELEDRFLSPGGIMLMCAQDNVGAKRFYARLGYREVGLVESYVKPGLHEAIFYKPGR